MPEDLAAKDARWAFDERFEQVASEPGGPD